jgi:regulator of nucleoside diphosphate kinase
MMVDIRHLNGEVSDAMREFAHRRIAHVLQSLAGAVCSVDVNTADTIRPGGGSEVECNVSARLSFFGQPVTLTGKGPDAYAAILDATARLYEAVSQALEEQRPSTEPTSSPAGAPQRPELAGGAASGDVVVTAMDRDRLRGLIRTSRDARDREAAQALADELDRALVVSPERVADNVVTMNSRVVFEDESTGENREVSLVYPQDSDPTQGRVSVFAPVGTALLGLSAGQTIDWPLPHGQLKRYRVVKIVHQPEAAGIWHGS